MSYPLHMSPVAQSAAVSLLDEFRSGDVSLLDEVMRLFFSNSNLTVNLYPLIILAASVGLVLLLTFLMSDGINARVEQGLPLQQGYPQLQPQLQESDQGFNGASGLPLALAGYGYIVPVLNQNGYNNVNQPFVNVGYTS